MSADDGLSWTLSPDAGESVWNGQWHNVVGTYDGSTVRLYVDGRQVGSGTPDTTPIAYGLPTSNEFAIGNYPWCPESGFSGSIDEVKLFNRALGPQEIGLAYTLLAAAAEQLPVRPDALSPRRSPQPASPPPASPPPARG